MKISREELRQAFLLEASERTKRQAEEAEKRAVTKNLDWNQHKLELLYRRGKIKVRKKKCSFLYRSYYVTRVAIALLLAVSVTMISGIEGIAFYGIRLGQKTVETPDWIISYFEGVKQEDMLDQIETVYEPVYIPEGFVCSEVLTMDYKNVIKYSNEKDFFYCTQSTLTNTEVGWDSEIKEGKEVMINGYKGIQYQKNNRIKIIWITNEYLFFVHGNILQHEMIKVAESIAKK